jgi:hypothetical protein
MGEREGLGELSRVNGLAKAKLIGLVQEGNPTFG